MFLLYATRKCPHFPTKLHLFGRNIFSKKCVKYGWSKYNVISASSSRSCSTVNLNFENDALARYVCKLEKEYNQSLEGNIMLSSEIDRGKIEKVIALVEAFREIEKNINSLMEMKDDCKEEDDFSRSVQQEVEANKNELLHLEEELVNVLLPSDEDEKCTDIVMEIMPGVGGQESTLFAKELFDLYYKYLKFIGWDCEIIEVDENGIGGIKNATLTISGNNSFKYLRFEGGVHQVQRVPKTEKGGRMHTSTASVAVYPRPSEVDVIVKDEELEWEAKTSRGPGGQHVNKVQSAVRLTHRPTGLVIECQVSRSHNENRRMALRKLCLKLFQMESDKHTSNIQATRKAQIKNKCRNEKARTYNFPQNRITDHRFKKTINNISRFFEGEEYFHDFLEEICELYNVERTQKFLESLKNIK